MANFCDACNTLTETAPGFILNGVTSEVCTNLANNQGLNANLIPPQQNCEALAYTADCLVAGHRDSLPALDFCNPEEVRMWMVEMMTNMHIMIRAMLCDTCGQRGTIGALQRAVSQIQVHLGQVVHLSEEVPGWQPAAQDN